MKETILLVDDDEVMRSECKELFKEYHVLEAHTAHEALRILQKPHSIDCILLDVMLPDVRGTDILTQIKQSSPETGVIIFTAYGSKDVAIDALRGRADEFLEKNISLPELNSAIERVIEKTKKGRDASSPIGRMKRFIKRNCFKNITLDDLAHLVHLSPKYVSRLFKEKIGMGINEYRIQLRVSRAKELLTTTELTVSHIAGEVGYENVESFIRQFKKHTKMTPQVYRAKNTSIQPLMDL